MQCDNCIKHEIVLRSQTVDDAEEEASLHMSVLVLRSNGVNI